MVLYWPSLHTTGSTHLNKKLNGIYTIYTKKIRQTVSHQHIHMVKLSKLYLYSAFNNTNCVKATAQYQNRKIVCQ